MSGDKEGEGCRSSGGKKSKVDRLLFEFPRRVLCCTGFFFVQIPACKFSVLLLILISFSFDASGELFFVVNFINQLMTT